MREHALQLYLLACAAISGASAVAGVPHEVLAGPAYCLAWVSALGLGVDLIDLSSRGWP